LGCLKLHIDNEPTLRLAYSKKVQKPLKITLSYYPFGLLQKGYNNTVSANSTLGRFTSVDPYAEERNWLNPYNFVQNNPILRIDPSGLLDTYGVNDNGDIEHLDDQKYYDEDGNEVDRLYKTDDNGNKTNKSVDVEKGVLDESNQEQIETSDPTVDYFSFDNAPEESRELFQFLAENTEVEWFHVEYGQYWYNADKSYIGTGHHKTAAYGHNELTIDALIDGYAVTATHSHPGGKNSPYGPSGFSPGPRKGTGDAAVARHFQGEGVKLKVYDVNTGKTILYGANGIISSKHTKKN